jgi:membrane protein YdbS with pleckstrin-like domain
MHCPHCGADIPAGASFCPGCGERLSAAPPPVTAGAGVAPEDSTPAPGSRAELLQQRAGQVRDSRDVAEQELWRGTFSYKAMMGPIMIAGVLTLMAIIVMLIGSRAWLTYGLLAATLILWLAAVGPGLRRRMGTRYRLTNQRFFIETGILRRVTDRIEVIDIDDLQFEQNLIERTFDVGSITLTSNDRSVPKVALLGIEHVQHVADLIDQARRAERNRRGLYLETS